MCKHFNTIFAIDDYYEGFIDQFHRQLILQIVDTRNDYIVCEFPINHCPICGDTIDTPHRRETIKTDNLTFVIMDD